MSTTPQRANRTRDHALIVRADWTTGPRTAAWDRLWTMILGRMNAAPTIDTCQTQETEVGNA